MAWPPRRARSPMQPRPRDLDDVQLWIEGYRRMLEGGLDRLGGGPRAHEGRRALTDAQQEKRYEGRHSDHALGARDPRRASFRRAARPCLCGLHRPELVPQWWGRRSLTTRVDKMDVRPAATGGSSLATRTPARRPSVAATARSPRLSGPCTASGSGWRATSASRLAILERDRLLAALACALVVEVATLIPALGALAITAGVCVALVVFETMLPARPRSSPLPGGPSGRRQSASAGRAPSP